MSSDTDEHDAWTAVLVAHAAGSLDPRSTADVEAALRRSPALAAELTALERVRDAVRSVEVDAPPANALARVWSTIEASAPPADLAGAREARDADRWRPLRRQVVAAVAVAAVLFLVAVSSGVLGSRSRNPSGGQALAPDRLLMVSADKTVAKGTAVLDVSGRLQVSFDGAAVRAPGTRPEVSVELGGEGAVRFSTSGEPADYRFTIRSTTITGPLLARPGPIEESVIDVGGVRYESSSGGPFSTKEPTDNVAPFEQVLVRPDLLARLPDLATGPTEDLGTEQLGTTTVRHLRFLFDPGVLSLGYDGPGTFGDVLIGVDDDVVRQFEVSSEGDETDSGIPDAHWTTRFTFTLHDLGQPVVIDPP
ncbi:MAG: hypothetical protein ABIV94_05960 [Acidimicrobiales bacterium]